MSVRIGHASIDERGKITGGNAGDQTGKEVCIRSYYLNNWRYVVRAKDPQIAEAMAKACEIGCKNDNIGYSQSDRNSLYKALQNNNFNIANVGKCNTDCSAFMVACAITGGIKELNYKSNAPTTSTMYSAFRATGRFDIYTDAKYLLSDKYLRRGDILISPGRHTVMVLDNGTFPTLKRGSRGNEVKILQSALNATGLYALEIDGIFGELTEIAVKDYQKKHNLIIDGICGKQTRGALRI